MITHSEPISMSESLKFVAKDSDLEVFAKKFVSLDHKEAEKMKRALEELNLIKLKKAYIAKVIDLMPENVEDLNKIFIDVSLDEDENKKILDVIKQFK